MSKYKSQQTLIEKFEPTTIENNCIEFWEKAGIYQFNPDIPQANTFAIDTPPPTVSGSLHIGHIMSYSQAEILARFQRMMGKNLFFPIGWDDNGLPTERRVQNYFNIKCDPKLPFDPDFKPEHREKFDEPQKPVSRRNFVIACNELIEQDEKVFEDIFRRMGFSYDWRLKYSTISDTAVRVAQQAFLNLYDQGDVKSVDAPTMWDTGFQTAVAQAEVEDRDTAGFFHDIKFTAEDGTEFVIATTRPEFLPACIAVVAHPDDERYKHLFGKNATVPLFGLLVPIMASEHADPEKGTGIMMVCTFGDAEDVKFWKANNLPLHQIIGRDGRIMDVDYLENAGYEKFKTIIGMPVKGARKAIVEMLRASDELVGEPHAIQHAVKFYEKGDVPLEFVSSRQWFISILDKKEQMVKAGREIKWTPEHMGTRYENWTNGLNQDWAISRQRFFGVPFPVWYKLDENGEPDFNTPILATNLPCDPMVDVPNGFTEDMRGKPNGFTGDPDVMDTWAVSSLTPKIAMAIWNEKNPNQQIDLLPFDARPQAHDIIRTWAFYTIAQSLMNDNQIPWHQAWISGFVLDPDRKKMSKSKGNVVVPSEFIEKYGADAVRLWAASSKLGIDGIADEKIIEQKRKLVMKFYNASKFVYGFAGETDGVSLMPNDNPVDMAFWNKMLNVVRDADKSFKANDYTGALIATEQAFWDFCDNYLEIVKTRAYAADSSALRSLRYAIEFFCAMFAPFMPFITEEVWQAHPYKAKELTLGKVTKHGPQTIKSGDYNGCDMASVHKSLYPSLWPDFAYGDLVWGTASDYDMLCELVKIVRGKKTENGFSMKKPIAKLVVKKSNFIESASVDVKNVLGVDELVFDADIDGMIGELVWGE